MSYKNPICIINNETPTQLSIQDIIYESSYMFYEFRDEHIEVTAGIDGFEGHKKFLSPLFDSNIIDNIGHAHFLSLILEELPFYHKIVEKPRFAADPYLSYTRDPAIADVPTFLHSSKTWNVWFRESHGDFHNNLLLNIFNKLRYPFIDENQYLNAGLFPRLANELYSKNNNDEVLNYIEFKTTAQDNEEDIKNNEEGCLDYLEGVIRQKILSCYSMIDYRPDQSSLLDAWSDSLYWSGRLLVSDLEREKTIYKLQDVGYELLRRKFAGSNTLYNIALSCIDRSGSFINTTTVGDIYTKESYKFRDNRIARLINLPGITSAPVNTADISIRPIKAFYEAPLSQENTHSISLGLLTPLYYTSAGVSSGDASYTFSVEDFYLEDIKTDSDKDTFKNKFLRDRSTTINWDAPESILDKKAINYTYPTLDMYRANLEKDEKSWQKLDAMFVDESNSDVINCTAAGHKGINCNAANGVIIHDPIHLDIKQNLVRASAILGSQLDINADHILYHKNSLQETLESSYPYITSPIANNNSISLMDTSWINYLESSTTRKSRVQDTINFGTQISNFFEIAIPQVDSRVVFTLEAFEQGNCKREKIGLYKNTIYYKVPRSNNDTDAYTVVKHKKEMISLLTSPTSKGYEEDPSNFNDHDSYDIMSTFWTGLMPFTYSTSEVKLSLNEESYKQGVYEEVAEDGTPKYTFYDQLGDHNYTKAVFIFSVLDNLKASFKNNILTDNGTTKVSASEMATAFISNHKALRVDYSSNVKSIYYVLPRYDALGNVDCYWSESIPVIIGSLPIVTEGNSKSIFHPDWFDMCYQLNPQLNFESESASPLRRKNVFKAPFKEKDNYFEVLYGVNPLVPTNDIGGPSSRAALCNLARLRGYEFLCNDLGLSEGKRISGTLYNPTLNIKGDKIEINTAQPWVDASSNVKAGDKGPGFYLDREFTPKQYKPDSVDVKYFREPVSIFGDNRFEDFFDDKDTLHGVRSSTCKDDQGVDSSAPEAYCLGLYNIEPKTESGSAPESEEIMDLNSGLVLNNHKGSNTLPEYFIDNSSDGFTIFFHYRHIDDLLKESLKEVCLIYSEKFKLTAKIDGNSYSVLLNGTSIISVKSDEILKESDEILKSPIRLGISIGSGKIITALNNHVEEVEVTSDIQDLLSFALRLGAESNSINDEASTRNFYGCIYDLRLYCRPLSKLELVIYNKGTLREQYSTSPSTFTLSQYIYTDNSGNLGVIKQHAIEDESLFTPTVDKIRVFNRGVWDSILVDTFPILPRESDIMSEFYHYDEDESDEKDIDIYKIESADSDTIDYELHDAIMQDLAPVAEINGNIKAQQANTSIYFKGKNKEIKKDDLITLITTTLHPSTYSDAGFVSEGYLITNRDSSDNVYITNMDTTKGARPIEIPIDTVGNSLEYKADLNLNFQMSDITTFESFYSAGNNIRRLYNNSDKFIRIGHTENSLTNKSTKDNYVLLPLTLPAQKAQGDANYGTLDRFLLENVKLSSLFTALLSAKNYYTEFRLPVAMAAYNDDSYPYYASKWTGIRTLKEGSYYITCKYPLQIIPFEDNLFNANDKKSFAIYYGAVRFRIDVKGTPRMYEEDTYRIEGYPDKYKIESLYNHLEYYGIENPLDNKSFPHRYVNIDLYVMNKEGENFKWDLIASNEESSSDSIVKLDRNSLQNELIIKKAIPLFLSKNYAMPFFVAEENEDGYNSINAVEDLTSIRIAYNNLYEENFIATEESHLDPNKQTLFAGRSYKLLFDYDANITELSFSENAGNLKEDQDWSFEKEKAEYAKMYNLLNKPARGMYNSTVDFSDYLSNISAGVSYLGGFYTENYDGTVRYADAKFKETKDPIAKWSFGDPYSKHSKKNLLLHLMPYKRTAVNNNAFIPYALEDRASGDTKSFKWGFLKTVQGISIKNNKRSFKPEVTLDEVDLLKKHYTSIRNSIIESVENTSKSASGVFDELYSIDPYVFNSEEKDQIHNTHKVGSITNELLLYKAAERTNIITNNFSLTRASLYMDNMLYDQDFLNIKKWEFSKQGVFESSDDFDKDIFTLDLVEEVPVYAKWIPDSVTKIRNDYEVAINCSNNAEVFVALVQDANIAPSKIKESDWIPLDKSIASNNLIVKYTEISNKQATTVVFKFIGKGLFRISSIFTRLRYVKSENHGLYDITTPYRTDSKLITKPHNIILFRNKDNNSVLPIQFSSTYENNHIKPFNVLEEFDRFILNPIVPGSNQSKVIPPWKRLLVYKENEYNDYKDFKAYNPVAYIYAYNAEKRPGGNSYEEKLQPGTTSDIYRIPTGEGKSLSDFIDYDDSDGKLNIKKIELVDVDKYPSSILSRSNLMYMLDKEDNYLPVSITNEKLSGITNCFNVERYYKKESSTIAVTNIQYLDSKENVIYEVEYLPIIYDESTHHISINTIFRKTNDGTLWG